MVLRKYYYLDEDFINSAYSDIFGHVYQEEEVIKIDENKSSGKLGFNKGIEAEIGGNKGSADTIKFNAEKTGSAKLQEILKYLSSETGEVLPYYEQLDDNIFAMLRRDELFEGVFSLSFTKIEQYAQLADVTITLDKLSGSNKIDTETSDIMDKLKAIANKEREKGLVCILHFVNDKKFPCYCRIDESFLKFARKSLLGEVTMICKVSRKIQQGTTVDLTDLTELTKLKVPNKNKQKGRQQQLQQIKSGKAASVKEFQDEIKGPALEVVPIAIYK